jgi:hypothetical protein
MALGQGDTTAVEFFIERCRFVPVALRDPKRRFVTTGGKYGRHLGLLWKEHLVPHFLELFPDIVFKKNVSTSFINKNLVPVMDRVFPRDNLRIGGKGKPSDYCQPKTKVRTLHSNVRLIKSNHSCPCVQMKQKVGTAMAILYVVLVNENNCGLVYEEQETYDGHCFVETDLQKFVSFQWP